MQELKYVIKDEAGIHARPAGVLVKLANGFDSDIKISRGEKSGNLKKIFTVMSLAVKSGDEITLTFEGNDEIEAKEKIATALEENL